jgi:calcium-dependent protein kinase
LESKEGEWFVKLIDFGFANFYSQGTLLKDLLGTPIFMAPEIICEKPYDCKVDIWSCGIMLQMMLTGKMPFRINNGPADIFRCIQNYSPKKSDFSWCVHISDQAIDFLLCCLKQNPKERYSATKLLQHPWLIEEAPDKAMPKDEVNEILTNLRQFNTTFKLEQAVYTYLAMNAATLEDEKYLRELFKRMDSSQDGKISKEEFIDGMRKAQTNQNYTDFELELMFQETDADNNGSIDYIEFVRAAMNKKKMLSERNLKAAFDFFDKDHNGSISKEEIKQVFAKGNVMIGEQALRMILSEIDSNADMNVDI